MRVDLQSVVLRKGNTFKQQVEFRRCESSRFVNNVRRWDASACLAERETQSRHPLHFDASTSGWILREFDVELFFLIHITCYGLLLTTAYYWRDSFTRSERKELDGTRREKRTQSVVPRQDFFGPTNLHLAQRQMSAQPELSLYASRSSLRSCIFYLSLAPLTLLGDCSPFLFKFHLVE